MNEFIPYGHQEINEADVAAVVDVLRSDFLTQGPVIPRFEKAIADSCGAKYAVAVTNATSALHLAYRAAGLKPGQTLWTSPNTFAATANGAFYCGANVDFVDIDLRTYNIDTTLLEEKLAESSKRGNLPAIVAPVHIAGHSCEMTKIRELSQKYKFTVVEDASHAIGGSYKGQKIGSCQYSDMCVFSFHPVKIITTGEGGMVLTNRKDLYDKLILLRSHGITRNEQLMTEPAHGPWYYQQLDLGYNYRMTDIQAALGLSQSQRLDEFVAKRNKIAKLYDASLAELPIFQPHRSPDFESAFHLYVIRLNLEKVKKNQKQIFEGMIERGVGVNLHYIPVHLHPYYKGLGFKKGDFPKAEEYYASAMTLPLYVGLTETRQKRVIETLKAVLQ